MHVVRILLLFARCPIISILYTFIFGILALTMTLRQENFILRETLCSPH